MIAPAVIAVFVLLGSSTSALGQEALSRGAKSWAPTVTSASGLGTAHAVAEAKVTRDEIAGWCANWTPDDAGCVAREMATDDAKRTYRASADCTTGRITPIDGETYTLDGVWDGSDIGEGRTRWRDAAGRIVGRDNASGGLAISQQWEVLCPGPLEVAPVGKGPAAKTPKAEAAPAPATGGFAVGDVVEAKYGRDWVRGRIDKIRPGPEYDVKLENGQRGIVPPRMIRKPAS